MTTQKVSTAFIGIILVSEGRVLALEVFATGQQSHQAFLAKGIDLPELPHSGWMYRFDFRAEFCDPTNYTLASNAPSSSKSWLSIFGSD
jgi:hypothetical protein